MFKYIYNLLEMVTLPYLPLLECNKGLLRPQILYHEFFDNLQFFLAAYDLYNIVTPFLWVFAESHDQNVIIILTILVEQVPQ